MERTGDRIRGTRAAARLGEGFAILLAGVGIWMVLAVGGLAGLWLIGLAFLLGQAARGAIVQTAVSERIDGVMISDIMDRQPVAIPSLTPVTQALDEFFLRFSALWLPVVDAAGRFVGIARLERLRAAADGGEGWLTVDSMLESDDAGSMLVADDRPLTDLLSLESLGTLGAVMAVDGDGVLSGIVTAEQVRRALSAVLRAPAR